MFEPETEVVELQSRLGRVGSIQAWNPWKARKSVDDATWWVSKIARLSHGLDEAEDYKAHFDRVVYQARHESVLEFVPSDDEGGALPQCSLRNCAGLCEGYWANELVWEEFEPDQLKIQMKGQEASAFLVEAPIFVARQWMRHRSFAYLEMSRRYVKGTKIKWEYYGDKSLSGAFWQLCEAEYERRLECWTPNEIARGCMPVEAMTKFWVAGFDIDWCSSFLRQRLDEHAQPEIRVFAQWIRDFLASKQFRE